jgi:hypothetical protein
VNFTIDGGGALAAGQGIGNLIKAAALAPMYRQNAEQDAMLKGAQVYNQTMSGNKAGTEAELLALKLGLQRDPLKTVMLEQQVPLDRRAAIETFINTGSFGPSYDVPADGVGPVQPAPVDPAKMSTIARSMALYNKTLGVGGKVDDMAQAADIEQKMRDRAAVIQNPALALPTAQAFYATSGNAPFDNVGNTGMTLNALTGNQFEGSPALAKLFADAESALANQRNAAAGASGAAAGLSSARRDRVTSGLDKPVTVVDDETGQASVTAIPTRGDPRTIGVAPPKGNGVDATNAKAKNAIIAAVEKEMPGADEATISAEVEKRLARRGLPGTGNKNPAASASTPKIPSQSGQFKSPDEVKAAYKAGKISREAAMATLQRDFGMK